MVYDKLILVGGHARLSYLSSLGMNSIVMAVDN